MTKRVRVRFAPSPTGHLHIGGARTALFNWLFARHEGGDFVLRIEDTDRARSTEESERAVLEDLRWLGLDWDEGPDVGGQYGPYRQSERTPIYAEAAERLLAEGLAFRCYCTDAELEEKRQAALASGRVPQYDGACRNLTDEERRAREAAGRAPAIRLRGPDSDVVVDDLLRGRIEFKRRMLGDFIILRSDGRPTYNFAVVVDDALMEISHVIRAEEHLPNTMRQVLLYDALGFDRPTFVHVSLVVARDRSKLSKRHGASSIRELQESGFIPDGVVNYLALLGWSHPDGHEILTRGGLVESFDLGRVSTSPAAYDEDKLGWVNAHAIREADLGVVAVLAEPFLKRAGLEEPDAERLARVVALGRESVDRLSELPGEVAFLFDGTPEMDEAAAAALGVDKARSLLGALRRHVANEPPGWTAERFVEILRSTGKELGVKGKDLYMPVRAALTGRTHGPSLGKIAEVLGDGAVGSRLERALEVIEREGRR